MELFNRIKLILLKPKEEWEVIEAENFPHEKVLPYLLILALIPAAALFFNNWWQWNSSISREIQQLTDAASKYGNINYLEEAIKRVKKATPFNPVIGIVEALTMFVIIVGSAYISAVAINALSDQFGVKKDFNRSFSLVAYSYTPLCVAGILYAYPPLKSLAPYIGLYGLYLLYIGVKPRINPPTDKQTGYLIMAVVIVLAAYLIIPKIVQPISNDIRNNILIEQAKEKAKHSNVSFYDTFIANMYPQQISDYRRAAEQGDVWAQSNLGYCYLNGHGVMQAEEIGEKS